MVDWEEGQPCSNVYVRDVLTWLTRFGMMRLLMLIVVGVNKVRVGRVVNDLYNSCFVRLVE